LRVSGSDYVFTGGADDTVILSELHFRQLDGGKGHDILTLLIFLALLNDINEKLGIFVILV
jgi:hypothetical protein